MPTSEQKAGAILGFLIVLCGAALWLCGCGATGQACRAAHRPRDDHRQHPADDLRQRRVHHCRRRGREGQARNACIRRRIDCLPGCSIDLPACLPACLKIICLHSADLCAYALRMADCSKHNR